METLYGQISGYYASLPQGGIRVTAIRVQPKAAELIAAETCPTNMTAADNYARFLQEINKTGKGMLGQLVFQGGAVGCDLEIEVIPRDRNLSKAWRITIDENGGLSDIVELE